MAGNCFATPWVRQELAMLVTDSKRNHENTIGHAGLALCAGWPGFNGLDTWARTSAADHGARDPSHLVGLMLR
jgi:hypothetical protein